MKLSVTKPQLKQWFEACGKQCETGEVLEGATGACNPKTMKWDIELKFKAADPEATYEQFDLQSILGASQ